MPDKQQQHIQIEERNGIRVYSAGPWPGWTEVIGLCGVFSIILALLGGMIYFIHHIQTVYEEFFYDFLGIPWLNTVFSYIVMGAIDFSFVAGLVFLCLWLPYFLIYQLSPKQFWIENDTLFHTAYLLGFIPHKRKISFEQILDIEAKSSNGRHAIKVLYERSLPKWLFVILVYWNEKFTQWPMMLVNGIPTMEEAQELQTALLEPMTASPVCRVGAEPAQSPGDDGLKTQ